MPRWLLPLVLVVAVAAAAVLQGAAAGAQRRARQPPRSEPPLAAAPAPPRPVVAGALSPRNASYWIEASLDPAKRTISGKETITWRNISNGPTSELRFHLYYNAWKNSRSTWLREALDLSRRSVPLARLSPEEWGWTQVTSLRLIGVGGAPPIDLSSQLRYDAPDDNNADDRTVLVAPLSRAVAPGETVNIAIEWNAQVPRTFARTGVLDHYYFIAQWFPKIGVLEDGGWNCHQFHSGTEFFSDYGIYDVYLTVPRGWVVGATGVEREKRENGETTTHHYYQADVHDFAWTTSPDYVVRTARFEHAGLPSGGHAAAPAARARLAGRSPLRGHARGAARLRHLVRCLPLRPHHRRGPGVAERHGRHGVPDALHRRLALAPAPVSVTTPEGVTIHECGHQFWYGIVGNNEFEDAWMDEGFNTYSTARAEEEAYTPNYYSARFFGGFVPWVYGTSRSRASTATGLSGYRAGAKLDAQSTPSWRYYPAAGGALSYAKTALWLHTLERYLGWPTMQRIMSTYFARWRFRHPKPQDFFAVVNEVSGRDMTWFFDQVYRSSNVFDYALDDLKTGPAAVTGFVGEGGKRAYVAGKADEGRFHTVVVARRLGEAIFPVDVEVTFASGEKVRQPWSGAERWKSFTFDRPSRAVSARVDPDRILLLDANFTNNSRTLSPATEAAARKWSLTWMAWLEDLLLTYAYFI